MILRKNEKKKKRKEATHPRKDIHWREEGVKEGYEEALIKEEIIRRR